MALLQSKILLSVVLVCIGVVFCFCFCFIGSKCANTPAAACYLKKKISWCLVAIKKMLICLLLHFFFTFAKTVVDRVFLDLTSRLKTEHLWFPASKWMEIITGTEWRNWKKKYLEQMNHLPLWKHNIQAHGNLSYTATLMSRKENKRCRMEFVCVQKELSPAPATCWEGWETSHKADIWKNLPCHSWNVVFPCEVM